MRFCWAGFCRTGFFRAGFFRSVGRGLKLASLFAYATLELMVQRPSTRQQRAEWLHRFCARVLRRMGVAVRVHGRSPERGVVISNHLGYLDVVAFAALHRCVFVAKSEIRGWPFLGWLTAMAGTVYVERGRGGAAERVKAATQAAVDAGLPLVFFPEGTTSLGDTVLKFHTGLLMQAIEAGQPITAAHVRYRLTEENGPTVSLADVCFWDRWRFTSFACWRCAASRSRFALPMRPSRLRRRPNSARSLLQRHATQ